jgi:hypothetical protein
VHEDAVSADLVALITKIVHTVIKQQPKSFEGIIVPGSYKPENGTVEVVFTHTDSIPQGTVVGPFSHPIYPLLSPVYQMQAGPRGGERCQIIPREGGTYGVLLEHDTDDSPNTPAGEFWYLHKNLAGTVDGWTKSTNDGPTAADGLGGFRQQGGAYHETQTGGGHSIVQNDTAKTIKATSAGGHTFTMNDANRTIEALSAAGHKVLLDDVGQAISMVSVGGLVTKLNDETQQITHIASGAETIIDGAATKITHTAANVQTIIDGAGDTISHVVATGGFVGLGALASSLSSTNSALNLSHLSTYETNRKATNLTDLIANANLMHTAGIANSGQLATMLASLVAGFTSGVTLPTGSAKVRISS